MSGVSIEVDEEQLRAMVAGFVFKALTEETKQALMERALASLLDKPRRPGSGDTKVQAAFNEALAEAAKRVAGEMIASEHVQQQLRELLKGAMTAAFEQSKQQLQDKLVSAIGRVLGGGF